jgi:hypothetical protein
LHVICVILLDSLNREKIVRYLWQKFFSGASFSLYVKLFSRVNKDCSIVNIFKIFIFLFYFLFCFILYGGVNLANFYLFFSLISKCFFMHEKMPSFLYKSSSVEFGVKFVSHERDYVLVWHVSCSFSFGS